MPDATQAGSPADHSRGAITLLGEPDEAATALSEAYFTAARIDAWPLAGAAAQQLADLADDASDPRKWARHAALARLLADDRDGQAID